MKTQKVLIVDDSPVVRRGLAALLDDEPGLEVCGEAEDVPEALGAIQKQKPALVILDLKLHESNGLDLLKQLRGQLKSTRVLVCSVYDDSTFAERVIRAGASGLVSKNAEAGAVLHAVKEVLAGRVYVSGDTADQLLHRIMNLPQEGGEDPLQGMSDREVQVFTMLGEGLTIQAIAEQLHLSPRTIETYRDNIKHKLGAESSREVVRRATQWAME